MARIAWAPLRRMSWTTSASSTEEKVAFGAKKNKVGKNKTAAAASQYQLSE